MNEKRGTIYLIIINILGVISSIVVNIASDRLPEWLQEYIHLSWPILIILAVLSITLIVIDNKKSIKEENNRIRKEHKKFISFNEYDFENLPDIKDFKGRKKDIEKIGEWLLNEECKLITILGSGGVGKSFLATKISQENKNKFDIIISFCLINAPLFDQIMLDLLNKLSKFTLVNFPESFSEKINLFNSYLGNKRCLIIFDNFEAILESREIGGLYKKGYEKYGQFIDQFCKLDHRSSIIITSREKPENIDILENNTCVRTYRLKGVNVSDGKAILENASLSGEEKDWKTFIDWYSGNPQALILATNNIKDLSLGNIGDFLNKKKTVFGNIFKLLDDQFLRLSEYEKEIMFWLAVEREIVSQEFLTDRLISQTSKIKLIDTLSSLNDRNLIIVHPKGFSLQNMINEYTTEKLVSEVRSEILAKNFNYLTKICLLDTSAKNYIREIQSRLILKPIVESLLEVLVESEFKGDILSIIRNIQRTQFNRKTYITGNLINLLLENKEDINSCDFSNLSIWFGNFGGSFLQDVSFKNSNLTNSVFTEKFGNIHTVNFNSAGSKLAAGSTNCEIRIWDTNKFELLCICKGHEDWVRSIAFSPKNNIMVSGSGDQKIRVWDVDSGECKGILDGHKGGVRDLLFDHSGEYFFSCGEDGFIRIWDSLNFLPIYEKKLHDKRIRSISLNKDENLLATCSDDGFIIVTNIQEKREQFRKELINDIPITIAFHPSSDLLFCGTENGFILEIDIDNEETIFSIKKHSARVRKIAVSNDGKILSSGSSDGTIRIWDIENEMHSISLIGHIGWVRSVSFHPSGSILASGSSDQTIKIWDIENRKCVRNLRGFINPIWSISLNNSGSKLASGSDDKAIRIWDTKTLVCIKTLRAHKEWIWDVAYSPNEDLLASACEDGLVKIWDTESGKCVKELEGHTSRVRSLAFDHNGDYLASGGGDNIIKIWDVQNWKNINNLVGYLDSIYSIAYSPDSKLLASGGDEMNVKLWDAESADCIFIFHGHKNRISSVIFNHSGEFILSGGWDNQIIIWDILKQKNYKIINNLHDNHIRTLASFQKDDIFVSGSDDQLIKVFDLNGKEIKVFRGHTRPIRSIQIDPNSSYIYSSAEDETIRIWNFESGKCEQVIQIDRPYERMEITNVSGITPAQKVSLLALGAFERY